MVRAQRAPALAASCVEDLRAKRGTHCRVESIHARLAKIGYYINAIPLKFHLSSEDSLRSVLRRSQQQLLEALRHEALDLVVTYTLTFSARTALRDSWKEFSAPSKQSPLVGRWRRSTGNCRRLELSSSLLALLDEERQALGASTGRGSIVRESSADGSECRIVYSRCESAALGDIIVDEMARSHKRACTLEWKVYGHDHPPELPERLAEAGFKAADRESVLVLPLPTASLIPSPPPEIRRYVDDRGLSDHESIARALERSQRNART